jgi:regulator of protease activity HflC (stomatin/prohibitin superfamily)
MRDVIDVEIHQADDLPEPRAGWFSRQMHDHMNTIVILLGIALFAFIYLAADIVHTIKSGEVGVIYRRFGGGTQTDKVLGEGLKLIAPWDKLFIYNVRVQEETRTVDVLTNEGLSVKLDISLRYHPELETVGLLHQRVGPDYKNKVVVPEVESALRTVMASLPMREVYGAERGTVQKIINDSLEHVAQKYVQIDEVVIRHVELPKPIRDTIEQKMAQKELAESYEYRLEVERKEAERRTIEANSVKLANDILNSSLTPNILKWQGIEATKELAKAPGSRTVIIGGKDDGLPLILGSAKN